MIYFVTINLREDGSQDVAFFIFQIPFAFESYVSRIKAAINIKLVIRLIIKSIESDRV